MTWRTSQGDRALAGPEAILFRKAVISLADVTDDAIKCEDDPSDFGVHVFDRLTLSSRLAMLAQVGFALLRETPECPQLTAVNEATIAAVFLHIEESIRTEIDFEDNTEAPYFWRQLVRTASIEHADEVELPDESSHDMDEWEFLVEILSNQILWDNDFNSEACFADAAPEFTQETYEDMGIDDEYFLAVPPDPRDSNLDQIRKLLRELEHQ